MGAFDYVELRFPLAKTKVAINLRKTNRHFISINDYASFESADLRKLNC